MATPTAIATEAPLIGASSMELGAINSWSYDDRFGRPYLREYRARLQTSGGLAVVLGNHRGEVLTPGRELARIGHGPDAIRLCEVHRGDLVAVMMIQAGRIDGYIGRVDWIEDPIIRTVTVAVVQDGEVVAPTYYSYLGPIIDRAIAALKC